MDAYIFDTNFEAIQIIDTYSSFIWTERYNDCGDFELYLPFTGTDMFSYLVEGNYVGIRDSEALMIIESIELNSDVDEGCYLTITGRSLESILDRRIIWAQTNLDSKLQTGIKKLINENVISPLIVNRTIPNFIFEDTDDAVIDSYTIKAQFTGDNLLTAITDICTAYEIGYQLIHNDSGQFVFSIFNGVDRSYNQEINDYVIFSPKFENLFSTNYRESTTNLKTIALVAGEGEGVDRKTTTVISTEEETTGLERRELFVDARDISTVTDDEEEEMTEEEYNKKLQQRGLENLAEAILENEFEGEVDSASTIFKYGRDFFIGDIVQIRNEFGMEAQARIKEFIRSCDSTGYKEYPTFTLI